MTTRTRRAATEPTTTTATAGVDPTEANGPPVGPSAAPPPPAPGPVFGPDADLPVDRERGLALLRQLVRIRQFEERCVELYSATKIRGFLHLYIGEEAVAVGVMEALTPGDAVVATKRVTVPTSAETMFVPRSTPSASRRSSSSRTSTDGGTLLMA